MSWPLRRTLPEVGAEPATDQIEQGRFARTVWTDNRVLFARIDPKGHAANDLGWSKILTEVESFHRQRRLCRPQSFGLPGPSPSREQRPARSVREKNSPGASSTAGVARRQRRRRIDSEDKAHRLEPSLAP